MRAGPLSLRPLLLRRLGLEEFVWRRLRLIGLRTASVALPD